MQLFIDNLANNEEILDYRREEVERNIQEAIEFHIEGLREEGYPVPEPSTYSSYIDVAA